MERVSFRNVHYIIFSKDRPMQLDLLVRSLKNILRANKITVIASVHKKYESGYSLFKEYHPEVNFVVEHSFMDQTIKEVNSTESNFIAFLVDDIVFYRNPDRDYFIYDDNIICFSPRIGLDHDFCHPANMKYDSLRKIGGLSSSDDIQYRWRWKGLPYDIGYPFSLDGNIFRSDTIRQAINTCRPFKNPNTLEDSLVYFNPALPLAASKDMSCFEESFLVNIPINRVNQTHENISGNDIRYEENDLQEKFLSGLVIDQNKMNFNKINQSHKEIEFKFTEIKPQPRQD